MTQARSGVKRCTVCLKERGRLDGIVVTTSMPTAQGQMHLVETRQLLEDGHVHAQARIIRDLGLLSVLYLITVDAPHK